MNKLILTLILFSSIICTAQPFNNNLDRRYFYHWESVNSQQNNMEIIIHKENNKVRVTEIRFEKEGELGQAIIYITVYICKNKKNRMIVETIDPTTLQINNNEYILTKDKKLLRVTQNDTITFKRRYTK
jgi:hypothetical protein